MSVDFYANEFDVIEWADIKAIVPKEAAALDERLASAGIDIAEFCRGVECDDWDDADTQDSLDRLTDAWDKLDEAFTKATTVEGAGLELEPEYHDPYGPYGDEEEGIGFFAVEASTS